MCNCCASSEVDCICGAWTERRKAKEAQIFREGYMLARKDAAKLMEFEEGVYFGDLIRAMPVKERP